MEIAAKENKAGESIAQEGTQERRQDAAACSAALTAPLCVRLACRVTLVPAGSRPGQPPPDPRATSKSAPKNIHECPDENMVNKPTEEDQRPNASEHIASLARIRLVIFLPAHQFPLWRVLNDNVFLQGPVFIWLLAAYRGTRDP
ncbi:hypothetical protein CCHR01_05473 [Colletotrichum chrysophilum]|uniref:Uncharacterized protein n=1 Tax=Colletotrichum chrysophilum TaxID=1836956 RepID=A0AAD9APX8_9PEZI|nr:hypothetical protein CCHR01_05473 [Colletotrichum chrysophilum]